MDQSPWEFTIGIDREVWQTLKADAEPFVDTPNSVLRRRLGLDPSRDGGVDSVQPPPRGADGSSAAAAGRTVHARRASPNGKGPARKRAPRGSLLPEEAYELPILEILDKHGGRVPTREVIGEVGELVRDSLTPLDNEELSTGGYRWQKRIQFTRLRLVERGLVKKNSPRGVWEITDDGREALANSRITRMRG